MRNKDNAIDYRYMTEPNILTIKLDNDFVNNALGKMKKTPDEIAEILKQNNLNNNFISLLLNDYHLFKEFSEINDKINDMNLVSV
jgi:aspartyl-tRNA(Asn)/glutamyl-tRNA(Gln) amidotransferase subunit B